MRMFLHYDSNNEPERCFCCGSYNLYEEVKETVQGFEAEFVVLCDDCRTAVGYFAYGYYDPFYSHIKGIKNILKYFIRSIGQ